MNKTILQKNLKSFYLIGVFFVSNFALLQSQSFEWARNLKLTSAYPTSSIGVDGMGNVYYSGGFNFTSDFDLGDDEFEMVSGGSGGETNIYVSKVDPFGNFLWAKQMGGGNFDLGIAMDVDLEGNVYTTGFYYYTADFDPSEEVYNISGDDGRNAFVSKLNTDGEFVWAKSLGGGYYGSGSCITTDESGNVYTTGQFSETGDFDPSGGEYLMTSYGDEDIFISKLDGDGNFIWAKQIGGIGYDEISSIAVDDFENVYTTGSFQALCDFKPGSGTYYLQSEDGNIFVSKLNSNGGFVWAKNFGGALYQFSKSIAVDNSGNVYTTGGFRGEADFDPSTSTLNIVSYDDYVDIFISKLDATGNFVWVKRMGGFGEDFSDWITLDQDGNIFTTGNFSETADFNPGSGIANLTCEGQRSLFISKLNSSGNYVWAHNTEGSGNIYGSSIQVDSEENIYVIGFFSGDVDFDFGSNIYNLTPSNTSLDLFILKLNSSPVGLFEHLQATESLSIYPNPTGQEFTIKSKLGGEFVIYDQLGRKIKTFELTASNDFSVTVNDFSNGFYLIEGKNSNGLVKEKIIVAK